MVEPTTVEWIVTSAAVLAVVAVGALLVLGPALGRAATVACRVAGTCLAALAVATVLAAAVLGLAGREAAGIDLAADDTGRPVGPWIGYLIDADPDATEATGSLAPMVMVPLAAVLAVLAHAVCDPARTAGLRSVAGAVAGAGVVGCVLVAIGDAGPLASRAAVAAGIVAAGALVALVVDELSLRAQSRQVRSEPPVPVGQVD